MGWLRDLWDRLHASLTELLHWVEGLAAVPYGGWALFAIAFIESSVFPIPPDVLLIALCLGDPGRSLWFALLCSIGSVLGGMVGYGLGFFGGRPLLRRMFRRERIRAVEKYYDRYNAWATGIAGLTPLPYKLFTISGGVFAINFRIFVLASAVSRSLRFFAVAGLIFLFGEPIKVFIERYLNVLTIAFVILLLLGFWLVGTGFGRAGTEDRKMARGGRIGLHLRLTGRVQGVGFRYFAKRTAEELGLGGKVRNMPDGSVEIEVAGPPPQVDAFRERIQRGPMPAQVSEMEEQSIDPGPDRRNFEIVY